MIKGGKRYPSMSNDGKWFAHPASTEGDTTTREMCTITGIMLAQVETSLPQALNFERFPKCKTRQNSRLYPFSDNDNKHALKEVCVFTQGMGRKKCIGARRQHDSNFCLCHDAREGTAKPIYQTDFKEKHAVDVPATNRRFTRNHKQKSAEAASARAGEQFMWFGRHDSNSRTTLQVMAATNYSASCKP